LNMVVDIPIAIALGFDEPSGGLMNRSPRPLGAPVFSTRDWVRLSVDGLVITVGALAAYELAVDEGALVASTMLLTTLSLFHLAAGLLARNPQETIFSRAGIPGATQLRRYAMSLVLILAVTELGFLQRFIGTTELSFAQWWICIGLASSLILIEELIKAIARWREQRSTTFPARPALSTT
jgi:Ca2+-transporting ATPase